MADPGAILRKEIQKNFPQFGSIRRNVQFYSLENPTYNADTRVVTKVENINFPVKVILASISSTQATQIAQTDDVKVLSYDRSALVPALDMKTTPKVNDEMTIDNQIWRVKGVSEDPAQATFKMWIRPRDYDNTD